MKLKQYEVVTQPEFLKEPLQDILKRYKTIKKWAYILHDKDKDASPHYDIYLNFGDTGVESSEVAKWFGLQESQVEKVKGRAQDMLLYLIHGNDSQRHKYQYSPDEVVANFDFKSELAKAKILGNFDKYSYAQQLRFIKTLPKDEQIKAYKQLKDHWKLHCEYLTLNPDRDIQVMFITGKAGSGKTYYAKKFLEKLDYDFAVSSASNDPFQDYQGQDAIILDDVRDTVFEFQDLLKMLDNNTASSFKSRFNNKVFNGKMIVLTSSVPLHYWYKSANSNMPSWYREVRTSGKEDFTQLCRRISCYVTVTEDTVTVYNELDEQGKPCGRCAVYENEVKTLKQQKKQKFDFKSVFDSFCEKAEVEKQELTLVETDEDLPF
ncbi:MAG: hypothetical protein E7358_06635 [Clostridiales bacterium]|nr:hypothetical protein [Clostridiales bacterium]